jgi:hypothetical protein
MNGQWNWLIGRKLSLGEVVDVFDQFGETISLTEDEFEMVVQAGAQAFLQRWPE